MSITGFIILLVIAGVCGLIAQAIAGRGVGGFLVAIVLGFVGAYLGTWVAARLHLPAFFQVIVDGHVFPIVWSIIGAALFVAFLSLFTRRSAYY